MSSPQKWKLLSTQDISPSKWFPIELRSYQLPDGRIVDDFTVTTLADVAMVIPVTSDNQVVMVNQYKPGIDEVIYQFPAGRIETHHADMSDAARHELEEEAGIAVDRQQLHYVGKLTGFSTKASEIVHTFVAKNCLFNSQQHLDPTEDIEVVQFSIQEIDHKIETGEIWCAPTIAGWTIARRKGLV